MSAILSADDLNDFISPSVACIKPVESFSDVLSVDPYEVTTEDKLQEAKTAQISLTDCLACSGCVTSAEAVLVSMQSHAEVLNALDSSPSLRLTENANSNTYNDDQQDSKLFVASVSPQVRASLSATFGVTMEAANNMIHQLLSGPQGLAKGGCYGNNFMWVFDTDAVNDLVMYLCAEEMRLSVKSSTSANYGDFNELSACPKVPILSSSCPGWICYAEKTHPHVLPHLSKIKSPQALAGTLIKSVLSKKLNIDPGRIWHLAIMPCFDKKLEASRQELTDSAWNTIPTNGSAIRDVDCVITAREILKLAETRGIRFNDLPGTASQGRTPFPDSFIQDFLFSNTCLSNFKSPATGTSGGYLYQILLMYQETNPRSKIKIEKGRNADVIDYTVTEGDTILFKGARYYGFRNIQNLVRKLKPSRSARTLQGSKGKDLRRPRASQGGDMSYSYVEVMACPGGCTNGGGQIKSSELRDVQSPVDSQIGQKEWLARVEKSYFSGSNVGDSDNGTGRAADLVSYDELSRKSKELITRWSELTGASVESLIYTTYREVESDVGKTQETEKVAMLASKVGGGW